MWKTNCGKLCGKNFFVENSKIIALLMWKSKILIWIKINKTL